MSSCLIKPKGQGLGLYPAQNVACLCTWFILVSIMNRNCICLSSRPFTISEYEEVTSIGKLEKATRSWAAAAQNPSFCENYANTVNNMNSSFSLLSLPRMVYPGQVVSQFDSFPVTGYLAIYTTTKLSDMKFPNDNCSGPSKTKPLVLLDQHSNKNNRKLDI